MSMKLSQLIVAALKEHLAVPGMGTAYSPEHHDPLVGRILKKIAPEFKKLQDQIADAKRQRDAALAQGDKLSRELKCLKPSA